MKKQFLYIVVFAFSFASCQNQATQKELVELKTSFTNLNTNYQKAVEKIDLLTIPKTGQLVHEVYFKLKPDADKTALIKELKTLEAIPVIKNFEVGTFKDLEDPRALGYNLVFKMNFSNENDYKIYQKHEIHLALKKKLTNFLAGPPATYDYTLE